MKYTTAKRGPRSAAPAGAVASAGFLFLLMVLGGCASAPTVQTVKVPIPVACSAKAPDRPAMPTESLDADRSTLDQIQAAQEAEIELRESYEIQLVAALVKCTRPIGNQAVGDGH